MEQSIPCTAQQIKCPPANEDLRTQAPSPRLQGSAGEQIFKGLQCEGRIDGQAISRVPSRKSPRPRNEELRTPSPRLQGNAAYDPLLDVLEAAAYLKMHVETLKEKVRNRELACIRDSEQKGGRIKFRLSALNSWIKAREIKALRQAIEA